MTYYRLLLLLFLGTFSMRIFVTLDVFCSCNICMPSGSKSAPHDVFGSCDVCMTTELALLDFTAADPKKTQVKEL